MEDVNGNIPVFRPMIRAGLNIRGYPGDEIKVMEYIKKVVGNE